VNFLEAAEIAKKYPGSALQRGESGLFVVRMSDGRVISSPNQLKTEQEPPLEPRHSDTATRLAHVEGLNQVLSRQREIDRQEIDQLRLEVNNLKEAISKIPASEWSRFEEEHKKLERERQAAEAARLVGLARSGQLSYEQLYLVADNAGRLGISAEDLSFVREEISRKRPSGLLLPDSFVVHSIADGQ
jgi:hypothetical protein